MQAEDETKVVDREPELAEVPRATASASDSAHSLAEVEAGQTLVGRYELIHRLGHGGMASVYLGRAIGTAGFERLVAVKVIHPHLANEAEFVEMFLDEARIAAKIHDPHVCETLDLGDDDGVFFMVMEYVEGDTLSSLTRQLQKRDETLPMMCALQIISDACRGLAAAHDLVDNAGDPVGLVHRDVSPHNLLVSMDGRVKVVDFGIMKAAGKRSNTLTGQLRGKLTYMSPEQARGEHVDRRTDLYALGVILWELLAGARFYRGQTDSELLAQVSLGRTRDITEFRDDLPQAVVDVLSKAIAPDLDQRYATAQEMLKDLRVAMRERLDATADHPRELLGGAMKRCFSARLEYVHAAIRGQVDEREGSGRQPLRAANDVSRTSVIGKRVEGSSAAISMTPSVADIGRTGTLTTTRPASAARSWALWLMLPLAGAAAGTAVVSGLGSNTAAQAATTKNQDDASPQAAPASPAAPAEVKWWINSDPQGATVAVDGVTLTETTPTSIELPRGRDAIDVEFVLAGYKAQRLKMAPLGPENLTVRLQPAYKTTFRANLSEGETGPKVAEPSADTKPPPRKRPPRKRPIRKKARPPVAETPPVEPKTPTKADERKPEDVPDILRGKNRP